MLQTFLPRTGPTGRSEQQNPELEDTQSLQCALRTSQDRSAYAEAPHPAPAPPNGTPVAHTAFPPHHDSTLHTRPHSSTSSRATLPVISNTGRLTLNRLDIISRGIGSGNTSRPTTTRSTTALRISLSTPSSAGRSA